MGQRILLASGNDNKLAELQELCSGLPLTVLGPTDLPDGLPDVVEDGDTFEANARKKALAAVQAVASAGWEDCWTLADDSGLRVDALDGAPGVYSARYASMATAGAAKANSEDLSNNRRLLQEMEGVPEEKRGAAFHCVLVLAGLDAEGEAEVLFTADGSVRGRILEQEDGDGGFGYDPLFFHVPAGRTFARLTREQKSGISHRGEAMRLLSGYLTHALEQR